MAADPYSRLVLCLRIALPLIALGILSTLFLYSSKITPGDAIPFEKSEVEDRVRDRRVTRPIFTSMTSGGDKVAYAAEQLITGSEGENEVFNLTALVEFTDGGSLDLIADQALFDEKKDNATLTGNVRIKTTSGYTLNSDLMTSTLTQLNLVSPGPVDGTALGGTLDAAHMQITATEGGKNVQFLFSGGVKLVYDPKHNE